MDLFLCKLELKLILQELQARLCFSHAHPMSIFYDFGNAGNSRIITISQNMILAQFIFTGKLNAAHEGCSLFRFYCLQHRRNHDARLDGIVIRNGEQVKFSLSDILYNLL